MVPESGKRVKTIGVNDDLHCKVSEFQKACRPFSTENVYHEDTGKKGLEKTYAKMECSLDLSRTVLSTKPSMNIC